MSKVRSFRFNDTMEHMFNVIKSYFEDHGGITDSEIISNGIRHQYEIVAKDLDNFFKEQMLEKMGEKTEVSDMFERICDLLEILSTSQGSILQDEFQNFLAVVADEASVLEIDPESKEHFGKNAPYQKVWEKVSASYGKDELDKKLLLLLTNINELFNELFPLSDEEVQ